MKTALIVVWLALGCVLGWLPVPVSPHALSALCFAAVISIQLARIGERGRGFEEGYRVAARHAVDIARLTALQSNDEPLSEAATFIAERLRKRLEIEAGREP